MINKQTEVFARRIIAALLSGLLVCGAAQRAGADEPSAKSTLQFFPIPSTKALRVRELVIEPDGAVWAMGNDAGYVSQGGAFAAPEGIKLLGGQYQTGLWGGPDRGAYATQPGAEEHQGRLLRLREGQAEEFTSYYFDNPSDRPGIYVAKSGQLFNWGERFLATLVGKEWKRIEARFGPRPGMIRPAILDRGELVDFYMPSTNTLYRANRAGDLREEHGPAWLDGALKARPGVAQAPQSQAVALWGADRALLVRSTTPLLMAFDLKTLEQVDLAEINKQLEGFRLFDAFQMQNGDVWLLTQVPDRKEFSLYRLTVAGEVSEVVDQFPWVNTRTFQFPRAVCDLGPGGVLFGLQEDGLIVARDGKTMAWNWRQGLNRETPVLAAATDGTVWFANGDQVIHARIGNEPPAELSTTAEWDAFPLHSSEAFWVTAPGELAMLRADHPQQLSRLTAKGWTQQDLPVETSRIQRSAIDDRGHLLLTFADKNPRYLDIGPDRVTEGSAFTELVQAAIADGARNFRAGRASGSIVVVKPEQVWMINDSQSVSRFDGQRWDRIVFRDRVARIVPSAAYDALFCTPGKYFRYDRGQVIALEADAKQPRAMMFGESGQQPYDRALFERASGQYFPAVPSSQGWRMFLSADSFERHLAAGESTAEPDEDPFDTPEPPRRDAPSIARPTIEKPKIGLLLPKYFERLVPAPGGAWLYLNEGAGDPARLWEGQLLRLDFTGTPLADKQISEIVQDASGDLWFLTRFNHTAMAVRHRQANLKLHLPKLPRECGRRLTLPVGVQPGTLARKIRFAGRIDDGPWFAGRNDGRSVVFSFDSNGPHRCQVVGLLFGAAIGQPLSFEIDATDSIPDTTIEPPGK